MLVSILGFTFLTLGPQFYTELQFMVLNLVFEHWVSFCLDFDF